METIRNLRTPVNLSLTPNDLLEPLRKEVKDHGGDMVEFKLKDEFSLSSDERNTYAIVKRNIANALASLQSIKAKNIDNSASDLNPQKGEILLQHDVMPNDNYWTHEVHMKDGEPVNRIISGKGAFYCHTENDKTIINSYSLENYSKVVGAGGILNKDPDTNTITSGYVWEYNYKKEKKL